MLNYLLKDTDKQPDEVHRGRSGRVLTAGESVPMESGGIIFPRSSPNPMLLAFVWRLPQVGTINYELLLWRSGGRPENSKLLIMASSIWGPPPIQEPCRNLVSIASIEKRMLLMLLTLRNRQRGYEPCIRNGSSLA